MNTCCQHSTYLQNAIEVRKFCDRYSVLCDPKEEIYIIICSSKDIY